MSRSSATWFVVGDYAFAVYVDGRIRLTQKLVGTEEYADMTRSQLESTLREALTALQIVVGPAAPSHP